MGFHEDESRIRTAHSPENLAILRKIAMNPYCLIQKSYPGGYVPHEEFLPEVEAEGPQSRRNNRVAADVSAA